MGGKCGFLGGETFVPPLRTSVSCLLRLPPRRRTILKVSLYSSRVRLPRHRSSPVHRGPGCIKACQSCGAARSLTRGREDQRTIKN
ncbi:hypothetical protein E2C01_059066 [Portunus trituberculatus]|uniref:Uncharacterized protein n=1 Tax=Portunus trituberculatus TaxID=210409 RepID=A0A5B7H829_PORTR|nr:hypothetical protein [Portunus trituberculatus]